MSTSTAKGPHQGQPVLRIGASFDDAKGAFILVHGRGASAESILELGPLIGGEEFAFLAPQAAGHTWYPNSFLAPLEKNEPGLSSGLLTIDGLIKQLEESGIPSDRILLGGFSQGACLVSEYAVRHPKKYGGLLVFSGGVVGPLGMERTYEGSLENTPVFIGCSDKDFHIPLERVNETADVFELMGAKVNKKIYPDMGHTIIKDEINHAREIALQLLQ